MEFTKTVVPTTTILFRALIEEARKRYPTNNTAMVAGSFATAMYAADQGVRGFTFNDVDVYVFCSPTEWRDRREFEILNQKPIEILGSDKQPIIIAGHKYCVNWVEITPCSLDKLVDSLDMNIVRIGTKILGLNGSLENHVEYTYYTDFTEFFEHFVMKSIKAKSEADTMIRMLFKKMQLGARVKMDFSGLNPTSGFITKEGLAKINEMREKAVEDSIPGLVLVSDNENELGAAIATRYHLERTDQPTSWGMMAAPEVQVTTEQADPAIFRYEVQSTWAPGIRCDEEAEQNERDSPSCKCDYHHVTGPGCTEVVENMRCTCHTMWSAHTNLCNRVYQTLPYPAYPTREEWQQQQPASELIPLGDSSPEREATSSEELLIKRKRKVRVQLAHKLEKEYKEATKKADRREKRSQMQEFKSPKAKKPRAAKDSTQAGQPEPLTKAKSSPTKMRWNNRGKTQCWYQENQKPCKLQLGADCEWHHYYEQGKKPRGKAAEEPSAEK